MTMPSDAVPEGERGDYGLELARPVLTLESELERARTQTT